MTNPLKKGPSPMRSGLFLFGIAATAVWLAAGVYLMMAKGDRSNLPKPNEWGDIFAGLAAPVAFLWLVLGFLQQGRELQLSTRALELQVAELKSSVEQQQALVKVTREQMEANLQEIERAKQKETEEARPKFVVRNDGWHSAPDGPVYNFTLSNEGGPVFGLGISIEPKTTNSPQHYLPAFSKGEHTKMPMQFGQKFPESGVNITFRYTDERGVEGEQYHRIVEVETAGKKRLMFIRPVPGSPTVAS